MRYRSTRHVARILGVSVSLLAKAAWCGRVSPPAKSPSGQFLWTTEDVERASWALLHRSSGLTEEGDHQLINNTIPAATPDGDGQPGITQQETNARAAST